MPQVTSNRLRRHWHRSIVETKTARKKKTTNYLSTVGAIHVSVHVLLMRCASFQTRNTQLKFSVYSFKEYKILYHFLLFRAHTERRRTQLDILQDSNRSIKFKITIALSTSVEANHWSYKLLRESFHALKTFHNVLHFSLSKILWPQQGSLPRA